MGESLRRVFAPTVRSRRSYCPFVPEDALTNSLAEALRALVLFVQNRPDDATADDDVRALEDFAYVLNQLEPADRIRAKALLGDTVIEGLGWD